MSDELAQIAWLAERASEEIAGERNPATSELNDPASRIAKAAVKLGQIREIACRLKGQAGGAGAAGVGAPPEDAT